MKTRWIPLVALLIMATSTAAFAQRRMGPFAGPGAGAQGPASEGQMPTPTFENAAEYLGLSTAQVDALKLLITQFREQTQTVREQVAEKQKALNTLLKSNSTDSAAIGALMVEIQTLRSQIQSAHESVRAQALNVLTAEQKTKLAGLEAARALRPAIQEAAMLNLLTPPEGASGPMGGGPGMGLGGGPGMGRGTGPRRGAGGQ
jgi:Spy/CpxP family protein refolding chaperone